LVEATGTILVLNNIIAIIPARSGSKGIKNKNIMQLSGHPLISYSIAAAKLAGIKLVIVSTDSDEYADISKKYGAEAPFLRPAAISGDGSSDFEWMRHAMEWYQRNERSIPQLWLHLRPTTPLRDPKVVKSAISFIADHPKATSLRSGHEASESPFKWFLKDEEGYFKGLRDDLTPEKVNMPRQLFPKMYNPDGYIDIVRSSHVLNSETLHGDKMLVFESPRCTEIDTQGDFEYLEYEIKQRSSPLLTWLDNRVS
jgi:N-acylneuraminate cytidylyltransferase